MCEAQEKGFSMQKAPWLRGLNKPHLSSQPAALSPPHRQGNIQPSDSCLLRFYEVDFPINNGHSLVATWHRSQFTLWKDNLIWTFPLKKKSFLVSKETGLWGCKLLNEIRDGGSHPPWAWRQVSKQQQTDPWPSLLPQNFLGTRRELAISLIVNHLHIDCGQLKARDVSFSSDYQHLAHGSDTKMCIELPDTETLA